MEAEPLLRHLQSSHPQILYKPLFALSAATNLANVATHLRSVRGLSATLSRFWHSADPQMIVIVLTGGAGTKPSKGKGKEGERVMATVRLGRYACLVELLSAVEALDQSDKKGRALKTFAETIENRMSVLLEAQVRDGAHDVLTHRKKIAACQTGIGHSCADCSTAFGRLLCQPAGELWA